MADEREFSETELDNGMRCVFVSDPHMHDVAVRLDIGGGIESDPADLSGLAFLCVFAVFGGSLHFPAADSSRKFADDNDIECRFHVLNSFAYIDAILPHRAFDEYLDRLSDMVSYPEFSPESLKYSKQRNDSIRV